MVFWVITIKETKLSIQYLFNMETFITKDNKTIIYDNGSARVIDPKELEAQKADIEKRLAEVKVPTDKELLAWAKANYPQLDHSTEQEELVKINSILETVK